ncbi:MAG: lysophospholipid acyltransferase family protein [Acidobacteriota bacterium]|nr:lysophospholipid acyltransferase family protein [Acidobacteriota bacterium]
MASVIGKLRGFLRTVSFAIVTACAFVLHVVTVPAARLLGLPWARWSGRVFRTWSRIVLRLLGARVEVAGPPPAAPFFMVSNHLSYVDIAVLASQLDCVFVAKAEIADWPIFGPLCKAVGTIFVDRTSKRDIPRVSDLMKRTMKRGKGIVLFPEGTSTEGATVLKFKPALLEPAASAELPVVTATLTYHTPPATEPARLAVCWWGDMTFTHHVRALFRHPGFVARIAFGENAVRNRDRKILAAELWEQVRERFEPVTGSEAGPSQN